MTAMMREESVYVSRLKRLAQHLNVAIFYAKHSDEPFNARGFYLCGPTRSGVDFVIEHRIKEGWELRDSQVAASLKRMLARRSTILVTRGSGTAFLLDHEIGHHITDDLAYYDGYGTGDELGITLSSAFKRNGLTVHTESLSEVMAESLGQYLRGTKLNQILLLACERVLNDLPKPQAERVRAFRRRSLVGSAMEEMRVAA
jgi:hypothetical protein